MGISSQIEEPRAWPAYQLPSCANAGVRFAEQVARYGVLSNLLGLGLVNGGGMPSWKQRHLAVSSLVGDQGHMVVGMSWRFSVEGEAAGPTSGEESVAPELWSRREGSSGVPHGIRGGRTE